MRVLCRGRLRLKSANFLLEAGKLMSDSVMLSGRENFVASSVPRNSHRNSRRHGRADNILLNKAGTILLRSLRTFFWEPVML